MKKLCILTACLLCLTAAAYEERERAFVQTWAAEHGGRIEAPMSDGSRCDLLTETHAYEFDFAPKWKTSIGQALNYAMLTNTKAAVVLIITKPKDQYHVSAAEKLIKHYNLPIELHTVYAEDAQ